MPHSPPNRDALALNAAWKRQQAALLTTTQQNADMKPRHDVVEPEKPPVIYPDIPMSIPVSAVFSQNAPDTKDKRFVRFVKIYKSQVKAKQDKPITVQRIGDKYLVIDGARRVSAARVLKMETISAVIQDGEVQP